MSKDACTRTEIGRTVTSTKTRCPYSNLGMVILRRPDGPLLETKVPGAVQNSGALGMYLCRRHC